MRLNWRRTSTTPPLKNVAPAIFPPISRTIFVATTHGRRMSKQWRPIATEAMILVRSLMHLLILPLIFSTIAAQQDAAGTGGEGTKRARGHRADEETRAEWFPWDDRIVRP